ncbi:MAG: DNA mismatch repair protein MutS [Proteobacteria bacterium]|nr:DNA mismatch repair protein MutS [Pseudomonadota bacterium]
MSKLTPMLKQYFEKKEKYPDAILFFRMGDFYEMFFDDAVKAAPVLEIALTSRSKHQGQDIPMCGVPYHAAEAYIGRLVRHGFRVAVCDQVEDPRLSKGIVAREVTRVVTPGMVLSPEMDDPKTARYLAAICGPRPGRVEDPFGLAALDVSTGDFLMTEVADRSALEAELLRLDPAEVLVPEAEEYGLAGLLDELDRFATLYEAEAFETDRARRVLSARFGEHALAGFGGRDMPRGTAAAGAALQYAQETQGRDLVHADRLRVYRPRDFMVLDETSKRNLELFDNLRDRTRTGTLIGLIDLTVTAMGGRALKQWMGYPLIDRSRIAERQDAVEALVLDGMTRTDLRARLGGVHDLERLTGRISLGRAGPRDLAALRNSLLRLPEIKGLLLAQTDGRLRDLGERTDVVADMADLIGRALVDDPPVNLKEGGIFRAGYDPALDELITIMSEGKGWIVRLEKQEKERTGIHSLKVGFNRVFGYYIEVTRSNLGLVPDDYIRKQTLAGGERFITPELKEQEEKVLSAEERRTELEQALFEGLRDRLAGQAPRLKQTAEFIAEVDVLAAMAEAAVKFDYVRPELLDEDRIEIQGGRHPVIERSLRGETFVPNDVELDNREQQIIIITGPNMAGKSTILRQTALIVLLNQMGGFVPAEKARLGLVDRIFTRVGASDDLARGRSTFMVEMNETAQILNQATPRSLVVLDEIGRGTSTFDGMSIAWAVAEYLHDLDGVGVRTLFATHYHELVELARAMPRVRNYNVAVKEWEQNIIFLRKLVPGGSSRSYGLAVARLAGLPGEVLNRAAEVLESLENGGGAVNGTPKRAPVRSAKAAGQLDLFAPNDSELAEEIRGIDLNNLTPLQALNKLAELKRRV